MTLAATGRAAPRLLLDAREYAQRVLLQGADVPWEPTAHARLLAQVGALLRPDLSLLDLGAYVETELRARRPLSDRMSGARNPTAALRALLADDDLAHDAVALVRVVTATSPVPVAVQIASPWAWLAAVAGEARDPEFDADDAENASVYLADWIRRFSGSSVDTLILDGRAAPPDETLAAYGPLRGLTDHYRWALALRGRDTLELTGARGAVLGEGFWLGEGVDSPRTGDLVIGRIDPAADPETVLDARARWN
ncbi:MULTISPECIES: hypothetical protein [unclassified Microbacterium]|uniref:hypothetical protein n=1 Tax=unclassified Microbacterium TaxID=2609290 RepID=UPI003018C0F9